MAGKSGLYQLFDMTAKAAAGPIMAAKHHAPAIREFHQLLGDPQTMPGRFPREFELRHLGEQDEETGEIKATTPPLTIATGEAWLAAKEQGGESGYSQNSQQMRYER